MSKECDTEVVVLGVFEDVALLIGSVAAARSLPDELVHTFINRLDRVRAHTLRRISNDHAHNDRQDRPGPPRLHQAIEEFIFRSGQRLPNDTVEDEARKEVEHR